MIRDNLVRTSTQNFRRLIEPGITVSHKAYALSCLTWITAHLGQSLSNLHQRIQIYTLVVRNMTGSLPVLREPVLRDHDKL